MLTFSPTPLTLWSGLLIWLTVLLLGVVAWKRSTRRHRAAWLEGTRLLATSLVVLLLWVYYTSMILLYGAEFTKAWALTRGREIVPEAGAYRVETRVVDTLI